MNWKKRYEEEPAKTLEVMYHGFGMTLEEMGERLGVSRQAIHQRMERHGIERVENNRVRVERERLIRIRKQISTLLKSGKSFEYVAKLTDSTESTISWLVKNHLPNFNTDKNYSSRMWSCEQVEQMRTNVAEGHITQKELANRQGASPMTVNRMITGDTYTDCGGPITKSDQPPELTKGAVELMRLRFFNEQVTAMDLADETDRTVAAIYMILNGESYAKYGGPIRGKDYETSND